jgi:hypothetical protein
MNIPFIDTQNTQHIQNVTHNLINLITRDNINGIFNEINSTHATITQKYYFTNLLYTFFQESSLPLQLDLLLSVIKAIHFNSIHVEFDVALIFLQKVIKNPLYENILIQAIQQVIDNYYESFQYITNLIIFLHSTREFNFNKTGIYSHCTLLETICLTLNKRNLEEMDNKEEIKHICFLLEFLLTNTTLHVNIINTYAFFSKFSHKALSHHFNNFKKFLYQFFTNNNQSLDKWRKSTLFFYEMSKVINKNEDLLTFIKSYYDQDSSIFHYTDMYDQNLLSYPIDRSQLEILWNSSIIPECVKYEYKHNYFKYVKNSILISVNRAFYSDFINNSSKCTFNKIELVHFFPIKITQQKNDYKDIIEQQRKLFIEKIKTIFPTELARMIYHKVIFSNELTQ